MSSVLPAMGPFGADLYNAVSQLTYNDTAANNFAMADYINCIGSMFDWVETVARDNPSTVSGLGWAQILNLNLCPTVALPWLAQFKGVTLPPGITDAAARTLIRVASNYDRGTVPYIIASVQATLTGAQQVVVRERFDVNNPNIDSPYCYEVITQTAQTPDPTLTGQIVQQTKPAGLVATYLTITGQDWQSVLTNYGTWANVNSTFLTWQGVANNIPGS